MANTNSNLVASLYTSPIGANAVGQDGGRVRVKMGNFELAAADIDADGDTVRLARLPAVARIVGIFIGGDDLDGSTDLSWNIGLYEPGTDSAGPGTVIDEDVFASLITQQAARDMGVNNLITEAVNAGLFANIGERLWEVAGDNQGEFDVYEIVLTQTTAAASAAAGTLCFQIFYTID